MQRRSERNRAIVGAHSRARRGIIAIGAIASILLLLPIKSVGQPPQPSVTMSICDVLANDPTRLNGKLIKVRGRYSSTDEGKWLFGECKTHLETKGLVWSNSLAVDVDQSEKEYLRFWARLMEKLRQLRFDPVGDTFVVTFVGRLTTRATMEDEVVQRSYGLAKAGFGHLGESPAEIFAKSFEIVVVERGGANKSLN